MIEKRLFAIAMLVVCLFAHVVVAGDPQAGYRPEVFKKVEPVYIDRFDKDGKVNREYWQVKQKTVWVVKDGMLVGTPSSKEYQEHVRTEGDGIHTGERPTIILKPIPEDFVLRMRIKYEGDAKAVKIDIGHHVNSFIFGKDATRMKFNKKATVESDIAFPVNTWGELTFEFKKGKLLFGVNGKTEIIKNDAISAMRPAVATASMTTQRRWTRTDQ